MKFMCILHIQKNKDGIVLFEIVILIYSIDYKVVFRAALILFYQNLEMVHLHEALLLQTHLQKPSLLAL